MSGDSSRDRILLTLQEIMASDLRHDELRKLLFDRSSDAAPTDHLHYIHRRRPYGRTVPQYYQERASYGPDSGYQVGKTLASLGTLESHVHRRMAHIVVNPHDTYNTQALKSCYRYAGERPTDHNEAVIEDAIPANVDVIHEKTFVRHLTNTAIEQADLLNNTLPFDNQGKTISSHHGSIMFADKGCGKTFFLNYALSKYDRYFDLKKIIWVRINLVQQLQYDARLTDWINAQTAKIVIRYYCRESLYFKKTQFAHIDIDRSIREEISKEKSTVKRREMEKAYDKAFLQFTRGGHPQSGLADEPIGDSLIDPIIARHIVAAARLAGFRFIIALDGLDILDITRAYRRRFDLISNQAFDLLKSNKRLGLSLLLVMRTTTVRNIIATQILDPFSSSEILYFQLYPADLNEILTTRLNYLIGEIPRIVSDFSLDWATENFEKHVTDFRNFLLLPHMEGAVSRLRSFMADLDEIQGSNIRAKMHMLQYRYQEFVNRHRIHGLNYHAIESLMKAGRRFPPIAYRYSEERDGIYRTLWNNQKYDTRFLPSIFRFPFVSATRTVARSKTLVNGGTWDRNIKYTMMGLRLVQILYFSQQFLLEILRVPPTRTSNDMVVEDITSLTYKLFEYDRKVQNAFLEELFEYQLVDFQNSNLTFESDVLEDNEIICLSKLKLVSESLIYDIAYLNMAAMRMPLSEGAFAADVPFIRVASLEEHSDSLSVWVSCKIINVVSVVRLLNFVNREQELAFAQIDRKSRFTEREVLFVEYFTKCGGFRVAENVMRRALDQIERALASVSDPILSEIETAIERYRGCWVS